MIARLVLILILLPVLSLANGGSWPSPGKTVPASGGGAPTLTSRVIGTNGTSLTLTGSESLSVGAGGNGGFDVDCMTAGSGIAASYASGAPGSNLVYTLGSTVLSGDTCDLDYTQPGNGVEATTGGADLASITSGSITNNSAQTGGGGTISDDFSGTLGNWTQGGSYAAITSGQLVFSGEGCVRHNTGLGTGNKYFRFQAPVADLNALLALGCTSGGTCMTINIPTADANYTGLQDMQEYTTYTTGGAYESLIFQTSGVIFDAAHYYGVTFDKAGKTVRLWVGVTAATPTNITTWDGRAADATQTFVTSTVPGDYVGLGSWTGSPVMKFDNFSAGNIP